MKRSPGLPTCVSRFFQDRVLLKISAIITGGHARRQQKLAGCDRPHRPSVGLPSAASASLICIKK